MATRSTVHAIKSLFQDAMICIPYFISTTPTNTVAMSYDETIEKEAKKSPGYMCKSIKLYYEEDIAVLTLLIVFDGQDSAEKFYTQHNDFKADASNSEALESNQKYMDKFTATYQLQGEQNKQLSTKFKARMFYCRSISELETILFERQKISVQFPCSRTIRHIVIETARMIVIEGLRAEEELKRHLPQQPVLHFLDHNVMSSESIFYRWRVYSYLMGDGDQEYSMHPFEMIEGGVRWHPPSESVNEKYPHRVLNAEERHYFTCLVSNITAKKSQIEQAMVFCLQNISASIEICCIIAVSFSQLYNNSVNEPRQSEEWLPIMYLISDILFNSTNTIYRDIFSVLLPGLLSKFTRKGDANLKLNELLKIWQKKFIFEEDYFKGLFWSLKAHGKQKLDANIAHTFELKDDAEIEQLCYRYGVFYLENEKHISKHNLILLLSSQEVENHFKMPPEAGVMDGEELTERDIQKIKTKSCKAISCSGASLRSLFDKSSYSRSSNNASVDKE